MSNMKNLRVLKQSIAVLVITAIIAMVPLTAKADVTQQTYVPQSYVQQNYVPQTYIPQPQIYPTQPQVFVQQPCIQPVTQVLPYSYGPNYYGQGCYTPTGYVTPYPVVIYAHPDYRYSWRPSLFHYGINLNFGGRGCRRRCW